MLLTTLQRQSGQPYWAVGEEKENETAWFGVLSADEVCEDRKTMQIGEMRFHNDGTFTQRIQ